MISTMMSRLDVHESLMAFAHGHSDNHRAAWKGAITPAARREQTAVPRGRPRLDPEMSVALGLVGLTREFLVVRGRRVRVVRPTEASRTSLHWLIIRANATLPRPKWFVSAYERRLLMRGILMLAVILLRVSRRPAHFLFWGSVLCGTSLVVDGLAACDCTRKNCVNFTCTDDPGGLGGFEVVNDICRGNPDFPCTDASQGVPKFTAPLSRVMYEGAGSDCQNTQTAVKRALWKRTINNVGDDNADCKVKHDWVPKCLASFALFDFGLCCVENGDTKYIHARVFVQLKLKTAAGAECKDESWWSGDPDVRLWTLLGEYKLTQRKQPPDPCDPPTVFAPTPTERTFPMAISCSQGCVCHKDSGKRVETEVDFGFRVDNTGTRLDDKGQLQAKMTSETYTCGCCNP